jgi:hypothetical protein
MTLGEDGGLWMPRDRKHPRPDARILLGRAERELDAGAVAVAAALTANALVAAPTLPEAHELLARLAAHPEGGRNLFPLRLPGLTGIRQSRPPRPEWIWRSPRPSAWPQPEPGCST